MVSFYLYVKVKPFSYWGLAVYKGVCSHIFEEPAGVAFGEKKVMTPLTIGIVSGLKPSSNKSFLKYLSHYLLLLLCSIFKLGKPLLTVIESFPSFLSLPH